MWRQWRQKIVPGRTRNQSSAALMATVGRRIAHFREIQKWTRHHLARRLAVSPKTLANWEQGRVQVPVSMFVALAEHLGVSMDDLARDDQILEQES